MQPYTKNLSFLNCLFKEKNWKIFHEWKKIGAFFLEGGKLRCETGEKNGRRVKWSWGQSWKISWKFYGFLNFQALMKFFFLILLNLKILFNF
jgi:hypothetical protein